MASLGQHLRRHEEPPNGRLAFRRDCPICCAERTAGPLPDERIVPLKAQVTIAIGALVAGGAVPSGVAFADRGDGSGQAIVVEAPRVPVPPKHVAAPPDELGAAAAPVSGESDDPASEGRGVGRAEGDDAVGQDQTGASQAPPAPPTTTVTEASDENAPAPTTSPIPEPSAVDEDHTQTTPRGGDEPNVDPGAAPATAPAPARRQPRPPAARPVSNGTRQLQPRRTAERPQTGSSRAAQAERGTAQGGDTSRPGRTREPATATQTVAPESTTYVVKDGDCLWNVAARQLGAGAGDAAIAKEVTRLWKLNAKHIGTDDPDLIFTGQTLVL